MHHKTQAAYVYCSVASTEATHLPILRVGNNFNWPGPAPKWAYCRRKTTW